MVKEQLDEFLFMNGLFLNLLAPYNIIHHYFSTTTTSREKFIQFRNSTRSLQIKTTTTHKKWQICNTIKIYSSNSESNSKSFLHRNQRSSWIILKFLLFRNLSEEVMREQYFVIFLSWSLTPVFISDGNFHSNFFPWKHQPNEELFLFRSRMNDELILYS